MGLVQTSCKNQVFPRVHLRGYVHTVYPVLLASADFNDWWVVADRRHSYPQPFWRARTSKAGKKKVDFRPLSVVDVGKTISTRGVKYLKVTGVEIVLFYFFLFFTFHSLSQFNLEGGTCLHLHHGHLQCTSCHPGCHQWNHLWAICLGLCGVETIQLCWTREDDRVTGHKWAGKCDENYSCGDTWLGKIIPNSTEEIGLTKDLVWSCPDSVNLFPLNANSCMLHAELYQYLLRFTSIPQPGNYELCEIRSCLLEKKNKHFVV